MLTRPWAVEAKAEAEATEREAEAEAIESEAEAENYEQRKSNTVFCYRLQIVALSKDKFFQKFVSHTSAIGAHQ